MFVYIQYFCVCLCIFNFFVYVCVYLPRMFWGYSFVLVDVYQTTCQTTNSSK